MSILNYTDAIDLIKKRVAYFYDLEVEQIDIKTRKREILQARQVAQSITRDLFGKISLATVGYLIGKKDHATVLYSCRVCQNLVATDKLFAGQYGFLSQQIKRELIKMGFELKLKKSKYDMKTTNYLAKHILFQSIALDELEKTKLTILDAHIKCVERQYTDLYEATAKKYMSDCKLQARKLSAIKNAENAKIYDVKKKFEKYLELGRFFSIDLTNEQMQQAKNYLNELYDKNIKIN